MIIGLVTWELHLDACQSLKDKRRVIKSVKDRLHNKFNVSVAETGHHDRWQRAELSCCVVSNERRHCESVLSAADNILSNHPEARILDSTTSYL